MLSRLATELKDIFAKVAHRHDGDYEPKNTNIQTHISSTSNPHGTTASQVGLGNVTNNKQLKASASSTVGKIPVWSNTTGDLLGDGYAVETTLTSNTGNIPTSSAVSTAINNVASGIGGGTKPGVADIAALKALNTTSASDYGDKVMLLVENSGLYRLDRESSATADDNFVVAPNTGVGRWIKIAGSVTDHNLSSNIQGGATGEKYHISLAYYNAIPSTASGSNKLVTEDNAKLSKLETDGKINIDNVSVTEAQWTAFTNAINA